MRIPVSHTLRLLLLPCLAGFVSAKENLSVVDDHKILKQTPEKIGAFVDKKKAIAWEKIIQQLNRTRTKLVLPKASSNPLKNLYANRADGVVSVASVYKCNHCTHWHSSGAATGWILTADGVMVTNYHVFNGKKVAGYGIRTHDGRYAPVIEILAASKRHDVAIFRVGGDGYQPIPMGPDAEVGSDLHIIAHPDSRFYTYTSGRVSRYYRKRGQANAGPVLMAVTAEFARGSSGGPAMDPAGNVVGMVASTSSIYYPPKKKGDKKGPFQMVIRNCVPVSSIRSLIELSSKTDRE